MLTVSPKIGVDAFSNGGNVSPIITRVVEFKSHHN